MTQLRLPAIPIAHLRRKEHVMPSPTIVLVHGAFGDASSWRPVYDRLVADGHTILAPPNPLRGLPYDASFTASVIDQLEGPVVLVGHSYGGAVITVAGSSDKVAGLVYVAGVAPDEGESVNDLQRRFPSLAMGPLVRPISLSDGSVEASIDPARFHDVFAADVPDADAAFMAISQRPVSATAFDDPATAAAWRTKPSWAVFGTADYPVAPELHRFSYDRAGSTVTEVEGASHFLMLSQPDIVASVIREAVIASAVNVAA
jgi:pimeloyl-ACP methyl ester carboxylesterase